MAGAFREIGAGIRQQLLLLSDAKALATEPRLAYFSVSSRSSLIKEWAVRSALFLYLALSALENGVHGEEPVIGGY